MTLDGVPNKTKQKFKKPIKPPFEINMKIKEKQKQSGGQDNDHITFQQIPLYRGIPKLVDTTLF